MASNKMDDDDIDVMIEITNKSMEEVKEDQDLVTLRTFLSNSKNLQLLADMIPRPPGVKLTMDILNHWLAQKENREKVCYLSNTYGWGISTGLIKLFDLPAQDVYSSIESWSDNKFGIISGFMAVCDGRQTVSFAVANTLTKIGSFFWSTPSAQEQIEDLTPSSPSSSSPSS